MPNTGWRSNANPDTVVSIDANGNVAGGASDVISVTMILDTSALADGDVMGTTVEVPNAVRAVGGRAILQSITVLDEDDQGTTFDLVFFNANTSLGTANSAPSIADADARTIIAVGGPTSPLRISTADFIDLGASKIQTKTGLGVLMEAAAASTSFWVSGIARGAPTYTASGIRLQLGFLQD